MGLSIYPDGTSCQAYVYMSYSGLAELREKLLDWTVAWIEQNRPLTHREAEELSRESEDKAAAEDKDAT
jgi:hypothetical protein